MVISAISVISDREWLATRVGTFGAGRSVAGLSAFPAGVVVEPLDVPSAMSLIDDRSSDSGAAAVIALVGWPTGRHQSLVKAAEARLAGEMGATEVWLAVPVGAEDEQPDESALLSDMIAVGQAVGEGVRFGVIAPDPYVAALADKAGAEVVAVDAAGGAVPEVQAEVAVFGEIGNIDAVIDWLSRGAARVFPARPDRTLNQDQRLPAR
ncbi:hypothetical protein [Corynebacterium sp.]|uniref:hypothetical protein n=1 Tax=Corynebacterium sp. TaxID=1720 RepID=UPI0037362E21